MAGNISYNFDSLVSHINERAEKSTNKRDVFCALLKESLWAALSRYRPRTLQEMKDKQNKELYGALGLKPHQITILRGAASQERVLRKLMAQIEEDHTQNDNQGEEKKMAAIQRLEELRQSTYDIYRKRFYA